MLSGWGVGLGVEGIYLNGNDFDTDPSVYLAGTRVLQVRDAATFNSATINLGNPPANPPAKGANPPKNPPKAAPTPVPGATSPDDVLFYQDVLWALLNTNEFMLNH